MWYMSYCLQREMHMLRFSPVKTPVRTDFQEEAIKGKCRRLVPTNLEELKFMLDSCFHNKKLVPEKKQVIPLWREFTGVQPVIKHKFWK